MANPNNLRRPQPIRLLNRTAIRRSNATNLQRQPSPRPMISYAHLRSRPLPVHTTCSKPTPVPPLRPSTATSLRQTQACGTFDFTRYEEETRTLPIPYSDHNGEVLLAPHRSGAPPPASPTEATPATPPASPARSSALFVTPHPPAAWASLRKLVAESARPAPRAQPHRIIYKLRELTGVEEMGGTMRLGAWPCIMEPDSERRRRPMAPPTSASAIAIATSSTGSTNPLLTGGGLRLTGTTPDATYVEIVEIPVAPVLRRLPVSPGVQIEAAGAASALSRICCGKLSQTA